MASKSFTATAVGVVTGPLDAGAGHTFGSFNFKVHSVAPDCVVALETSPDNTTYTEVARVTGPKWGFGRSDHRQRYAHVNVISLGTGTPGLAAVINANP
jgi:hypothetical protein